MEKMKKLEDLSVVEKRLEIILAARLREKTKIADAISTQDELRKKSEGWSGVKEIRKWREARK